MKGMQKVAILCLAALVAVLLVVAIYIYVNPPIGYGITDIQFGSTRLYDSVIWVTVENNKNTSLGITAVFVNGTEWNGDIYPKLSNAIIAPCSRIVLIMQGYDWKRSDPQGTRYVYEITLITSDEGVTFSESEETPPPP